MAVSHLLSAWRAAEAAQTSSTIELATVPARLGGKLRGSVRLAEEWPSDWVGVRLTCSAVAGAKQWEEEQTAVRTAGPVTFEFDLPAGGKPTGEARWILTLGSHYEFSGVGPLRVLRVVRGAGGRRGSARGVR